MRPIEPTLRRFMLKAVEKLAGKQAPLQDFYERAVETRMPDETFWDAAVRVMQIEPSIREEDLKRIPEKGPLVIVANHPIGGAEAILAGHVIGKIRKDFKIMATEKLLQIPEVAQDIIAVYNEEVDEEADQNRLTELNRTSMLQAMRHLKNQGALIVFPAGEVSVAPSTMGRAVDREWNTQIGQMIVSASARVAPVFFDDQNSPLFQWVSRYLRINSHVSVFPRQTVKRAGTRMSMHVGRPIHPALRSEPSTEQRHYFNSAEELTEFLQTYTYLHDSVFDDPNKKYDNEPGSLMRSILRNVRRRDKTEVTTERVLEDIASPQPAEKLLEAIEILQKDPRALLVEDKDIQVFIAGRNPATEPILLEIGRAREETFRKVGEGSGKPLDLDEFDDFYMHMFIWHNKDKRIAGAYRLGRKNELFEKFKFKKIYTHLFFDYDEKFLKKIGDAVELGRSFVHFDYQHSRTGLLIFNSLWRAIAEFLKRNPEVDSLFGPVSISGEYSTYSKMLITRFLEKHHSGGAAMNQLIKPRAPFEDQPGTSVDDRMSRFVDVLFGLMEPNLENSTNDGLTALDFVIRSIEGEKTPLPPLVKHYTKLGARYLAFSVDSDFNTVDGLIVVDVDRIPRETMTRYFGDEGSMVYLETRQKIRSSRKDT